MVINNVFFPISDTSSYHVLILSHIFLSAIVFIILLFQLHLLIVVVVVQWVLLLLLLF